MLRIAPWKAIAAGLVLLVLGVIVPLLMVLGIIGLGFTLGFLSYGASVLGLFIGLMGLAGCSLDTRY